MADRKLPSELLKDLAPNNSDKAYRERSAGKTIITPGGEPRKETTKERQKLQPVVKGAVVRKKAGKLEKIKSAFFGSDVNVGEFILYDVLGPAFRNTMSDMGFGIIEMIFGTGRGRGGYRGDSRVIRDRGRSYVDYRGASSRDRGWDRERDRRDFDPRDRGRHDFDRLEYSSRGEAEDVLAHLVDLIEEYGEATVGSLYELSNVDSDFVDNNYGWTNLRDAYTERSRTGYIIRFPQPRPLK